MRIVRLARLIGIMSLLAILALPGSAFAQGTRLPAGGGAAASLTLPLKPSAAFSTAIGTLTVTAGRANISVSGTGLPVGTVVCVTRNAIAFACSLISGTAATTTFAHVPLTAISLAPGTTYAVTVGATHTAIVSGTLL
jgi:hypothetical protein